MTQLEMKSKRVSVVIPVYNREKYIQQTIQSVLDQSYSDVELIVVDDGSTDGSKELIEQFGARLMLLTHEGGRNFGQSASINLALEHITGEYVAILDSDDYWHPNKVESQVRFLEERPELSLVYSNGKVVDENGKTLHAFYSPDHQKEHTPEAYLLEGYFLLPNNSLMKSSVLRKTGLFDESLRAAQDYDMGIRVTEVAKFGYLNEQLFYYRRHDESISGKKTLMMWQDGFTILAKAQQRYPYPSEVVRKRRAVLHFRLAQCYAEAARWHLAGWHFLASGWLNPARAWEVLMGKEKISAPR